MSIKALKETPKKAKHVGLMRAPSGMKVVGFSALAPIVVHTLGPSHPEPALRPSLPAESDKNAQPVFKRRGLVYKPSPSLENIARQNLRFLSNPRSPREPQKHVSDLHSTNHQPAISLK